MLLQLWTVLDDSDDFANRIGSLFDEEIEALAWEKPFFQKYKIEY